MDDSSQKKRNKFQYPQYYAPDHYLNGDGQANATDNGSNIKPDPAFQSCEDDVCIVKSGENSSTDAK
ncbi:MAG: hypothetical protein PHO01_05570 [Desulfotomaculaceae bacterium]|nr:hypothetical protein [Desulfotomaculaceae bacterium]